LELQVREQDDAEGLDRAILCVGRRQCELPQSSSNDIHGIDPDDVVEPAGAFTAQLRSHDAGEDEHARAAANTARGRLARELPQLLVLLATEVVLEQTCVLAGLQRDLD